MIDLDGIDLTGAHAFLTFAGAGLTVYVMMITGHTDHDESFPMRWGRRAVLMALALSLLWSLQFQEDTRWKPWPPDVAVRASVVAMLSFWAAAVHVKLRRLGCRWPFLHRHGEAGRNRNGFPR